MQWLAVAAGGALGALGRYGLNGLVHHYSSLRFPLGTLLANVIGSALMGVMFVLIIERGILPPIWREFAMIGVLGAFTTFSTFSLDTLTLWHNGQPLMAVGYVLANVTLCLLFTLATIGLTRMVY
ncbi:MAG: fluoride efflux transporter CrcB [Porticoccaceae bacterium]